MNWGITWHSKVEGHQEKTLLWILEYSLSPCDLNTSGRTMTNLLPFTNILTLHSKSLLFPKCFPMSVFIASMNSNTHLALSVISMLIHTCFLHHTRGWALKQHLLMLANFRERLDQDPWFVKPHTQIQNYLFPPLLQRGWLISGKGDGGIQLTWASDRFWNIHLFLWVCQTDVNSKLLVPIVMAFNPTPENGTPQ